LSKLFFTENEIKKYLDKYKNLILTDNYRVALNNNRIENKEFRKKYMLQEEKIKEILISLEYSDFCYAVPNDTDDPRFQHEILYIFNKPYDLYKPASETHDAVEIYIKTNIIEFKTGGEFLAIISLHERNKPITYCFK
jgi:hypothetical protein